MALIEKLTPLAAQLRENVRLRWGLWAILVVLGLYFVLVLSDYRKEVSEKYLQRLSYLSKLERATREVQWPERVVAARALLTQLEGRLWQANTRGLAQATFQTWMTGQLRARGLSEHRLRVEPALDVSGHPGLWQVTARVEDVFDKMQLEALLADFANNAQLTVVDGLEIKAERSPRFTLVVKAYFQAQQT